MPISIKPILNIKPSFNLTAETSKHVWVKAVQPELPFTIKLPFPPSGNRQARHGGGAHYLSPEATRYRGQVAGILSTLGFGHWAKPFGQLGQIEVEVVLCPPSRQAMDADNRLKSLLDALVKAGLIVDDSNRVVRRVEARWVDSNKGDGYALVTVLHHNAVLSDVPAA